MSRSLVNVEPVIDADGNLTFRCVCDCATVTNVIVARGITATSVLTQAVEFAYTCDGCQTSHWLTLTPGPLQ